MSAFLVFKTFVIVISTFQVINILCACIIIVARICLQEFLTGDVVAGQAQLKGVGNLRFSRGIGLLPRRRTRISPEQVVRLVKYF